MMRIYNFKGTVLKYMKSDNEKEAVLFDVSKLSRTA